MARAMVHNEDIAKNLWGEATNTACHIVNIVYFRPRTKKQKQKTKNKKQKTKKQKTKKNKKQKTKKNKKQKTKKKKKLLMSCGKGESQMSNISKFLVTLALS